MNHSNSTSADQSATTSSTSTTDATPATAPATAPAPVAAPRAINVISPAARERLRILFQERAAMLPLPVRHSLAQQPADPWLIFELTKGDNGYRLAPTVPGASVVPIPHGMFVYVVLPEDPGRVYLGMPYGQVRLDPKVPNERYEIQGHTSITRRADVLYAGELFLNHGELLSWGNGSGHYRPPATDRRTNLLPSVQLLLPEDKFLDFWRANNHVRHDGLAAASGYLPPAVPLDRLREFRGYLNHSGPPPADGSATSSGSASAGDYFLLRVGNSEMPLRDVIDLGAQVDGQPLPSVLNSPSTASLLQPGLADRISFAGDTLQQQMQAQRIAGIDDLLFELAGQRTGATPMVSEPAGTPRPWIARMNALLTRVQTVSAMMVHQPHQNTVICLLPDDAPIRHTALGLHLFGLYNGLRALRTAVVRGDLTGSILAGSELAATGVGVAVEEGLQRLGASVQRGADGSLSRFARTALGMRLGGPSRLGGQLTRAAPLAGALITAPFDAYNAVDSFRLATQSSGSQAQDHYVNAGLATASFVTTVGLGAAGYAGLASAGMLGLGVGVFLVLAGRTYHSVRYVNDLQHQIPLSAGEVVSTGLRSVIGMDPSQHVQDRLTVSTAADGYRSNMRQQLQSSLGHLGQLGVSHMVFGDAFIKLRPPRRTTEQVHHGAPGVGMVESTRVVEVPQPPIVIGNSGDDAMDAGSGLETLHNVVDIAAASGDKVLWMTGTGDDTLVGVRGRSNLFDVRAGKKTLRGGNEADRFELQVAPTAGSSFDGGLGADTLLLSFATQPAAPLEVALAGHPWRFAYRHMQDWAGDNLQRAQSRNWMTYPTDLPGPAWLQIPGWIDAGGQRSYVKSIENVVTSRDATTSILGNGQDNVFVLNGRGDSVDGGLGNDTYVVQGGGTIQIKAGAGDNRYQLQRTIETVQIDSARAGRHTLHMDFYLHELLFEAKEKSVEIGIAGDSGQRIVLDDIYRRRGDGQRQAVRADGQLRIMTRDGMAVTPLFSRYTDEDEGFIELLAKPWDESTPQRDRFATAHEIHQLDQLVAASGGWQPEVGVASTAGTGSVGGNGSDALTGQTLAMAA